MINIDGIRRAEIIIQKRVNPPYDETEGMR